MHLFDKLLQLYGTLLGIFPYVSFKNGSEFFRITGAQADHIKHSWMAEAFTCAEIRSFFGADCLYNLMVTNWEICNFGRGYKTFWQELNIIR